MPGFTLSDSTATLPDGSDFALFAFAFPNAGLSYSLATLVQDLTPPSIGNASPAGGSTIGGTDALAFDITDAIGVAGWEVSVSIAGASPELVHDGAAFAASYVSGSTLSNISGGKRFSIRRSGSWVSSVQLSVRAWDAAGNVASQAFNYTGPAPDTTAPAIASHTTPGAIASTDPIDIDIGNDAVYALISAVIDGQEEVAWDFRADSYAGDFGDGYSGSVTDLGTGNSRYSFTRDAGWAGSISVTVWAQDSHLNNGKQTYSYSAPPATPSDITPPYLSNISPPEGSTLAPGQAISLEVTDDSGLASIMLLARFSFLDAPELVHDGDAFSPAYAARSSREAISGGWRYTLLRKNGWPEGPKLLAYGLDTSLHPLEEAP